MSLATLAQLKTHLGFKTSDTQYDAKLTLFLSAGSDFVESYCARVFASQSYTELFHGNRSNFLNPRQWPIISITELRISSERDWVSASSLISSTAYGISSDKIEIVYYDSIFPKGYDNVRLQYTAGYSTMPNDLVMANLWASEWFYLHNNRGDAGRTSASKQGESIGILDDIPAMIRSILANYKRVECAAPSLAMTHV
jgi:hypothetical protein